MSELTLWSRLFSISLLPSSGNKVSLRRTRPPRLIAVRPFKNERKSMKNRVVRKKDSIKKNTLVIQTLHCVDEMESMFIKGSLKRLSSPTCRVPALDSARVNWPLNRLSPAKRKTHECVRTARSFSSATQHSKRYTPDPASRTREHRKRISLHFPLPGSKAWSIPLDMTL